MKTHQLFPKDSPGLFPFKAGRGHFVVTMYRFDDGEYQAFKLPYVDAGRRMFHRFPSYEQARDKGNEMIDQLAAGHASAVTLTNEDKLIYTRAIEALCPFKIKLDTAVLMLVAATKSLDGTGASLDEAAREYAKRHKNTIPNKSVADSVAEFLAAKTKARKSKIYLADLDYRLSKFKTSFNCNLSDITEAMLRRFLDGLKLSPRSNNNFHSTLVCFFRWCIKKKYLAADWNEFASIQSVECDSGEIEIFIESITVGFLHSRLS